jgi:hypothetical protein
MEQSETLTPEHALILEALRLESASLAEINRQIIAAGGEPIPPRPEYLKQAREHAPPVPNRPITWP